jgi:cysteine-rich repeat protein
MVLLFLLALTTTARAQVIEVPSFPVGPTTLGWFEAGRTLDVGAGGDGGFGVAWMERRNANPFMWALVSQTFSASGTPQQPSIRTETHEMLLSGASVAGFSAGYSVAWISGDLAAADMNARFLGLDGSPVLASRLSEHPANSYDFAVASASLPSGPAFFWLDVETSALVMNLRNASGGPRTGILPVGIIEPPIRWAADGTFDGGIVVVVEGTRQPKARFFDGYGVALGAQIEPGVLGNLLGVAASPAGDVAAIALRRQTPDGSSELWVVRITSTGVVLGETLVAESPNYVDADISFDPNGNLYVAWSRGTSAAYGSVLDRDGVVTGPALTLATDVGGVRTVRLASGNRFVNVFPGPGPQHTANVVNLCTPGTSVCGDGVFDAFCERCDDGAANSDSAPDACRTSCDRAHCGDGVTDTGEQCDDGNATACDGCTACRVDVGLGCGNGVAIPACGETCDDGNDVLGDGCTPECTIERVPGGGPRPSDCIAEWSIDNPANHPLRDKHGDFNRAQACADNDPRCDFDGGIAGSCTFHLRVCVNNTDVAGCEPGTRLATWTLRAPSAGKAAHDPVAAAQRSALFDAVLPNVIGSTVRDLCSPPAEVVVPRRSAIAVGKLTLTSDAAVYSGTHDVDKLRLTCLPPAL